jgi:ElaB/YqjD/DUF883 family membrane-anchored ribosome-binding protein
VLRCDRNFLIAILFIERRTAKKGEERRRKAKKGSTMTTTTRAHVRSVVSDAQDKGREAVEAVGEVRDNMSRAIDKSLKDRPYTTLVMAVGIGFLLGALWAR